MDLWPMQLKKIGLTIFMSIMEKLFKKNKLT